MEPVAADGPRRGEGAANMATWLARVNATPSVVDGLIAFQVTGSPLPAMLALAAVAIRRITHLGE